MNLKHVQISVSLFVVYHFEHPFSFSVSFPIELWISVCFMYFILGLITPFACQMPIFTV